MKGDRAPEKREQHVTQTKKRTKSYSLRHCSNTPILHQHKNNKQETERTNERIQEARNRQQAGQHTEDNGEKQTETETAKRRH